MSIHTSAGLLSLEGSIKIFDICFLLKNTDINLEVQNVVTAILHNFFQT